MTKPVRIQLKRTKGWKMPANTVKVDRKTKWGNPFKVGETFEVTDDEGGPVVGTYVCMSAAEAVDHFRAYMDGFAAWELREEIAGLRGKNLACWCKPGEPCHADVLLELANK